VDVMIAIRSGFFYTRTVPCELWFFDRNKLAAGSPRPSDGRGVRGEGKASTGLNDKNHVLMLDARSIGQLMRGSRKVYEFTPEQMRNLSAIVWLYRGQRDRFLALVKDYFSRLATECAAVPEKLALFDTALQSLDADFAAIAKAVKTLTKLDAEKAKIITETLAEVRDARKAYAGDRTVLLDALAAFGKSTSKSLPATNDKQHAARKSFDPNADRIKGLIKQVDLLYKLASRVGATAADLPLPKEEGRGEGESGLDLRNARKLAKQLDEQRRAAVDQLKHAAYFHKQIVWLQDRFPDAEIQPVPGLIQVVTKKDIEDADWSLTPGRYVGVAPAEVDEDFDFEQTMRDIHVELADLNAEAAALAARIQENFEGLGI
jgi:type I restriction enzyme M protein